MHGAALLESREKHTGAAGLAAAYHTHCHAHARAGMCIAGGPAGAVGIGSSPAAAGAMPRASAPQIPGSSPGQAGGSSRGSQQTPKAPAAGAGVVRYGKSHQPGLCCTRGISLIEFFQFSVYEDDQDRGNN